MADKESGPLLKFVDFSDPPLDQVDSETCKFILLLHDGKAVLVAGPLDRFAYHADLLERYCDREALATVWVHRPDLVEVLDESVEIAGGGYLRLYGGEKVEIYGASTSYGRYDPSLIERFSQQHQFFRSRQISRR